MLNCVATWSGFGGGSPVAVGLGSTAAPCIAALQHCGTGWERDQRPGDALRSELGRALARPSLAPICHLKTGAAGYEGRDPERFKRLSWTGKTLGAHLFAQPVAKQYL
ncbi:hypothetical protein TrVGV298_011311 [Trichoderma virens]|nr:hypothetical protein TrVGV298_011311 [Trichoderma virens]UKZ83169.1 hypothetical protein TrVFT333_010974 [Trichoderma virens FT-333]